MLVSHGHRTPALPPVEQPAPRRPLRVLETVNIAAPCPADWQAMRRVPGASFGRVRHCGACALNVYNLSGMARRDAEALLARHAAAHAEATAAGDAPPRLCVRLYRRPDGTVLTQDCGVARRLVARAAGAGAGAARRAAWWATCAVAAIVGAAAVAGRAARDDPPAPALPVAAANAPSLPPVVRRGLDRLAVFPAVGRLIDRLFPPPPVALAGRMGSPAAMGEMLQGDVAAPTTIPPVWVGVP